MIEDNFHKSGKRIRKGTNVKFHDTKNSNGRDSTELDDLYKNSFHRRFSDMQYDNKHTSPFRLLRFILKVFLSLL